MKSEIICKIALQLPSSKYVLMGESQSEMKNNLLKNEENENLNKKAKLKSEISKNLQTLLVEK